MGKNKTVVLSEIDMNEVKNGWLFFHSPVGWTKFAKKNYNK